MQNHEFELKPSRYHTILMATILLISIGIVIALPVAFFFKMALFIILFIYGIYLFRCTKTIIRIKRLESGKWLVQSTKEIYEGELQGDTTITGLVSVLRFKVKDHFLIKSCVVFRDALGLETYRQLIVVLRMY